MKPAVWKGLNKLSVAAKSRHMHAVVPPRLFSLQWPQVIFVCFFLHLMYYLNAAFIFYTVQKVTFLLYNSAQSKLS